MSFVGIKRESRLNNLRGLEHHIMLLLLMNCNYADNPNYIFHGDKYKNISVPLKRGQWITSVKRLEEITNQTSMKIRVSLKNLEKLTYLITNNIANRATLLTVVNIDDFLINEDSVTNQITNQITNQQQTDNKPITNQITTNNKNHTNNKSDTSPLPPNTLAQDFKNGLAKKEFKNPHAGNVELFERCERTGCSDLTKLTSDQFVLLAEKCLQRAKEHFEGKLTSNPNLESYKFFRDWIFSGIPAEVIVEAIEAFDVDRIEDKIFSWKYLANRVDKHYRDWLAS